MDYLGVLLRCYFIFRACSETAKVVVFCTLRLRIAVVGVIRAESLVAAQRSLLWRSAVASYGFSILSIEPCSTSLMMVAVALVAQRGGRVENCELKRRTELSPVCGSR